MEFSQRLAEAARLVRDRKRFFLDVAEDGIIIRAHPVTWGERSLTKIVSYKEIEQCRINPLIAMIERMTEELSAPDVQS